MFMSTIKNFEKSISEKIKTTDMKEVNKEMVKKWKSTFR